VKLSYKEARESWKRCRGRSKALEAEQQALHARMHEPEYYRQPPDALRGDQQRGAEIEASRHGKTGALGSFGNPRPGPT